MKITNVTVRRNYETEAHIINETITELIAHRRRQILVNSAIYYQFNENIIDDSTFDKWSKELADLQAKHPKEARAAVYAKEFEGFDGSSGFDLAYHYPEIQSTAIKLLRYHKELNRKC